MASNLGKLGEAGKLAKLLAEGVKESQRRDAECEAEERQLALEGAIRRAELVAATPVRERIREITVRIRLLRAHPNVDGAEEQIEALLRERRRLARGSA